MNLRLPRMDAAALSTEQGRRAFMDYFTQFAEQVDFTFRNLEEDNFASGVLDSLQAAGTAVERAQSEMQAALGLMVSRDGVIAAINSSGETARIAPQRVDMDTLAGFDADANGLVAGSGATLVQLNSVGGGIAVGFLGLSADAISGQHCELGDFLTVKAVDGFDVYVDVSTTETPEWRCPLRVTKGGVELFGSVSHNGTLLSTGTMPLEGAE